MNASCAVIGKPIQHSLSPVIHQHFAQQVNIPLTYERIEGDEHYVEQQIGDFFAQGGKGLNVTLPFKQRAFALAQKVTPRCQLAGAANTLWLGENGQLNADNTDGIGLLRDLARYIELFGKKVLILGAGGAARGIIHPLLTLGLSSLTLANRSLEKKDIFQKDFPQITFTSLDKLSGTFDLILNATSASLKEDTVLLPQEILSGKPFCYDLAYNRKEATPFVQYANNSGCEAVDGIGMLVEQAAEAFFIWHGVMPEVKPVLDFLK